MAVTAEATEVVAWLEGTASDVDNELLDRVFNAAVSRLGDDYDLDNAEIGDATLDPGGLMQDRVDQAAVMYAARLYGRRKSPNGVEAVGEWGPIRVSVTDPDVHNLLARWELVKFG